MVEIPKDWKPAGAGEEEIDYCLFDLVTDTHAGSETITFFNHNRSTSGLAVTNMENAGSLPAGQRFLLKGIQVQFDVNAAAGDAADSLDASALELYINNKLMYAVPTIAVTTTAIPATTTTATIGPGVNFQTPELDKAIVIQGGVPFKVTILTGKTAASANGDWTVLLKGHLVRMAG